MVYLKIILLKIARYFSVIIGNIIRFFRGNKNIDLKNIKKIIFNRKDRIGDAVITKPFIILFSKYVKEELKLNIEIEVECSKYNEFVFKEGDSEKYYNIKAKDIEQMEYGKGILKLLKFFITSLKKNIKLKNKYKGGKREIVYVDLVGNHNHTTSKLLLGNFYFIGPNLFFHNYLLDYSLPNNYVSGNKTNLIQSYINLVSGCFKLDKFEEYVNSNIEEFYFNYNDSDNKSGILIFIGNKEFRNLSIETRNELIIKIGNKNKNKNVEILDDNSNILYNKLIDYDNYPDNISFKINNFSWSELKAFAKHFELIIGIDGGGFNYIRTCTNSLEIFTLANPNVWHIFIGNQEYNKKNLGNSRFFNSINIGNKKFGFIYKKSFILPSYDQKINPSIFNDIKQLDNLLDDNIF